MGSTGSFKDTLVSFATWGGGGLGGWQVTFFGYSEEILF